MHRIVKLSVLLVLIRLILVSPVYSEEMHVLMLYSWFKDMPWQNAVEKGLKSKINRENLPVVIFEEYVDASRFPVRNYRDIIRSFYREKYSKKKIRMIISESIPAAELMEDISNIFPEAKKVTVQNASLPKNNRNQWNIMIDNDFRESVNSVIKVYNPVELAVIYDTGSPTDLKRLDDFRKGFAKTGSKIPVKYITGSNLDEVIEKSSKLKKGSAIFYLLYFQDNKGKRITPYKAVKNISEKANAPIFSHWNTLMGSGIVGGYMISGEKTGESIGEAILSLIDGRDFKSSGEECFEYIYDWNQLKKWNIKKDKIPQKAKILFYKPGIFETYPIEMTVLFSFIGILVLLSGALGYESQRRKKVSRKLKESQKRLNAILTANPDPVLVYDQNGKVLFMNPEFAYQFGWVVEDLNNWNLAFICEEYKDILDGMIKKVIQGKRTKKNQIKGISKKGDLKDLIAGCAAIFNSENIVSGIIINLTDISRQKKLELQLQQAQKMESVGRLAGGVAHDFNNMLSIIIGNAEIMVEEFASEDSIAFIKEIQSAAIRSSDLVRQLLAFARKQNVSPRVLDLNKTTENMLTMLKRLIRENIQLTFQPYDNLWPVSIDPSQLDQILANLTVNSRDAISSNGNIVIETGNITIDETFLESGFEGKKGDYVKIIFSDDGCGMDEKTREKLFEPFYTTKAQGKGTGLGLSTVFGIVKQNRGIINVYSEVGKGTSFHIYFPRYLGFSAVAIDTFTDDKISGGNETILIVEDEKGILGITSKILKKLGYKIIGSSDPIEALKSIKNGNISKTDLLITDLVMPKMNGKELSDEILKICPSVKCLYMSGYTAGIIARHGILEDGANFINKPFSGIELAKKIREILDN